MSDTNKHFNGLSPAEAERLALLLEELGETQHIIGKILRHGYESCHPAELDGPNNRQMLERELGDVMAAFIMLSENKDVDEEQIERWAKDKLKRLNRFLHHNVAVPYEDSEHG